MNDERDDVRYQMPSSHHRGAFMKGWNDAVKGRLYKTVLETKTHANMGNLFGWIYGQQPGAFKHSVWQQYCDATLDREPD